MTKTDIGEPPPDVLSFGILLIKELEAIYKTTFKHSVYASGKELVWFEPHGAIGITEGVPAKIVSLLFNEVGPLERGFIIAYHGYITELDSMTKCLEIAASLMQLGQTVGPKQNNTPSA